MQLAHLLFELKGRLESVGLVSTKGFQLPITQDVTAHVLGLNLIHPSRTLQSIAFGNDQIGLVKPDVLIEAANFPHAVARPN